MGRSSSPGGIFKLANNHHDSFADREVQEQHYERLRQEEAAKAEAERQRRQAEVDAAIDKFK